MRKYISTTAHWTHIPIIFIIAVISIRMYVSRIAFGIKISNWLNESLSPVIHIFIPICVLRLLVNIILFYTAISDNLLLRWYFVFSLTPYSIRFIDAFICIIALVRTIVTFNFRKSLIDILKPIVWKFDRIINIMLCARKSHKVGWVYRSCGYINY